MAHKQLCCKEQAYEGSNVTRDLAHPVTSSRGLPGEQYAGDNKLSSPSSRWLKSPAAVLGLYGVKEMTF